MMAGDAAPYPPLTARHKRILAFAAAGAIAIAGAVAAGRMAVIQWWLVHCDSPSPQCDVARLAFEWWWVAMLLPVLAITVLAHWLTRDRLVRQQVDPADLP